MLHPRAGKTKQEGLQLIRFDGIDEGVEIFRFCVIEYRAVDHVISAVAGQIIQKLLGMRFDLVDICGIQLRRREVAGEACPTLEMLLDFLHVRLVEVPDGASGRNVGIGDEIQPLVVGSLDKQEWNHAIVDQIEHDGLEGRPIQFLEHFGDMNGSAPLCSGKNTVGAEPQV